MRHIVFVAAWAQMEAQGELINTCPANALWSANSLQWSNLRDTGQTNVIPDPNVCTYEAWVEDAGVTLLEQDAATYTILLDEDASSAGLGVLGVSAKADKPKDEKPKQKEKNDLDTFLKAKGVKTADAAALSKKANANATRKQIADDMIAYCNALPKAEKVKPKIMRAQSLTVRATERAKQIDWKFVAKGTAIGSALALGAAGAAVVGQMLGLW